MTAPVVGLGRVPAVAAAPRQLGALLTAALAGDPDGPWLHGVEAWPESAPGYRLAGDHGDPLDHGAGQASLPVGARPFLIQTFAQCPRGSIDELAERAARQLDAVTSQAVAREMWTGALTTANPWSLPAGLPSMHANPRDGAGTGTDGPWLNPHLTAVTGDDIHTAPDPAVAVGTVEALAMAKVAGGPVFIHVPPMWLLGLTQFGIRPDERGVLHTPLGNVVVADAGYGAAVLEDAADLAVYATGPVQTWVGDPVVHDQPDQIVDTNTNQVGVWAERPCLYLFDPQTAVGCTITEV